MLLFESIHPPPPIGYNFVITLASPSGGAVVSAFGGAEMLQKVSAVVLGFLALCCVVAVGYAATITLNSRTSGQPIAYSGVTLVKCYFSGTVHMGDPANYSDVVSFFLSGVSDGGSLTTTGGGTDWLYG